MFREQQKVEEKIINGIVHVKCTQCGEWHNWTEMAFDGICIPCYDRTQEEMNKEQA